MAEINLDFTVDSSNINVTVEPNDITFTPQDVLLNVYAGAYSIPAGASGQLQYNNNGILGGVSTTSFAGGILSLGPVANVSITGGSNNQVLITNGSGVLSWATVDTANANYANFAGNAFSVAGANVTGQVSYAAVANSVAAANVVGTVANANYAAYAGNVVTAAQPNITSLGTLTGLTVNGTSNLSAVGNVKITGGTNGQYLQTDGTGNLAWVSGGGSGNGVVGGSNTQVQFNDAGIFGGDSVFTYNKALDRLSVPNIVASNIASVELNNSSVRKMPYGTEKVTVLTSPSGTYNLDVLTASIGFTTADAGANIVLNVRGNSSVTANSLLAVGDTLTASYVMQTGTTPYQVTGLQIDGVSQTVKWVNGAIPAGAPNVLTSYTFTAIKTNVTPTYTVIGSATRYA